MDDSLAAPSEKPAVRHILMIEASPRGAASASRAVADALALRLQGLHPSATLVRRDLAAKPLAQLDAATMQAISTRDPEEAERLRFHAEQSDSLIDELLCCALLVVATPMWNFGIPASLKAWIDLVVRPGRTFHYTGDGVTGLASGKRAILVLASGGVFSEGQWRSGDFVEPYLRWILAFIGIVEVNTLRIEGTNIPVLADAAVPKALENLMALPL